MERRSVEIERDKGFLLELHCQINYECEMPWARQAHYIEYKRKWLQTQQGDEFLGALADSSHDARTVAEIWENIETNEPVAFVWMTFCDVPDHELTIAELREIAVVEAFRRQGVASQICRYCEDKARTSGAKVLRSGTGACNVASRRLHEKLGFASYRVEFEKLLEQ